MASANSLVAGLLQPNDALTTIHVSSGEGAHYHQTQDISAAAQTGKAGTTQGEEQAMWDSAPALALPLLGGVVGIGLGYAARAGRFCTLGALERYWYGGDATGLRTWLLAVATAIAATQALVLGGVIDLSASFYLTPNFSLLGAVAGGLAFGVGMALVGTCGFGALIRLGGGSLRGLVVILVLAVFALAAQRGSIGLARMYFIEPLALDLAPAADQSLGSILETITGFDHRITLALALPAGILAWVFSERRYRLKGGQIAAGFSIGFLVAAGWLVTGLARQLSMDLEPVQLESASFVAPYADTLTSLTSITGAPPDYGVGLVLGVLIGAALAARRRGELRWEACDDARELKRHMAGAALMGVGGIFAMGCTIGQGVSAASTLAISAPIVMLSIVAGARVGLAWLVEGSIRHVFTISYRAPAE